MRTVRRISVALPLIVLLSGLPVSPFRTKPHVVFHAMSLRAPGILKASGDFRTLGVSWSPSHPAPANLRFRTSTDGRRWTSWTPLDATDNGPDAALTHEPLPHSSDPVWVGHARFADVRWAGNAARDVKLNVIDPGADPVLPASSAAASPRQPSIITRAEWGADESLRKDPPEYAEPLQMIFVHHTATTNSYAASDSASIVRGIYAYHVKTNGWNDIGYNFLIDRYGQIFEGRYGGMTRSLVGAHTLGFNSHSAGISMIGTFGSVVPPSPAMTSLKNLLAWRLDKAYISPGGRATMTSGGNPRYSTGTKVTLQNISGHRDVYDTDCPGQSLYNLLPGIRTSVAGIGDPKMYAPTLSASTITPNGDGLADASTLTARFSSTVGWVVAVLDPNGKTWFSKSGKGTSLSVGWNGKNSAGTVAPHDVYRFVINANNAHGKMAQAIVPLTLWRFRNGTLFRTTSGWSGILTGGKLGHLVALPALHTRYADVERIDISEAVRSVYPAGPDLGFRNGTLVRSGGTFLISAGQRRPISSATMTSLGFDARAIIDTTAAALTPTPQGAAVGSSYPDGSALYSSNGQEAQYISTLPRPFETKAIRQSYQIRDVDRAGPADSDVTESQTMTPIPFRDGSLIRLTGTTTVYVIADGKRHSFSSRHLFDVMGYDMGNVKDVTATELAVNPDGGAL